MIATGDPFMKNIFCTEPGGTVLEFYFFGKPRQEDSKFKVNLGNMKQKAGDIALWHDALGPILCAMGRLGEEDISSTSLGTCTTVWVGGFV